MTADNQRDNIRAELERATEALAAATLLYENGPPPQNAKMQDLTPKESQRITI